jgi:hypothetical protein
MGTSNGTFVNKRRIEPQMYVSIYVHDHIVFGTSTRQFVLRGPDELRRKMRLRKPKKELSLPTPSNEDLVEQLAAEYAEKMKEEEGVSWGGVGEEAPPEEDFEDETFVYDPNKKYTEKQQKNISRLRELKGKFERLSHEVDIVKSKGPTYNEQQSHMLERSAVKLENYSTEIEVLEQSLISSVRNAGKPQASKKVDRKSRRKQAHDSDDDDEFYDRTRAKKKEKKVDKGIATDTIEDLTRALEPQTDPKLVTTAINRCTDKIQRLRHSLLDFKLNNQSTNADSLDAYMNNMTDQLKKEKRLAVRKSIKELNALLVKLKAFLPVAQSHARIRAYQKGDMVAFAYLKKTAVGSASSSANDTAVSMLVDSVPDGEGQGEAQEEEQGDKQDTASPSTRSPRMVKGPELAPKHPKQLVVSSALDAAREMLKQRELEAKLKREAEEAAELAEKAAEADRMSAREKLRAKMRAKAAERNEHKIQPRVGGLQRLGVKRRKTEKKEDTKEAPKRMHEKRPESYLYDEHELDQQMADQVNDEIDSYQSTINSANHFADESNR